MAEFEPLQNEISANTLVVGGGISGMTAAIETAEVGRNVILIERKPTIGGRVLATNQYFPKLCPPSCGIEINLKRLRVTDKVRVLTLAEIVSVTGQPGRYEVTIRLNPRYVTDKCTLCGECEKVCDIERDNDLNYGLDKTKAIYLPHLMAYPHRYVVDAAHAADERMKKVAQACPHGAIDLEMQPRTITATVKAIVWATGWRPYDATKIDNLGFGRIPNVVTSVIMERLASESGPTGGRILRPSDKKEIKSIGFVQCAGSRDENHLPYCSAVCCLASMKQATYVRERYPDADVHMFYIDVRSPGRYEDFYVARQADTKMHFHRGKVGKIVENPATGNVILEAENTMTGQITKAELDMAVLAIGMVPNSADQPPPLDVPIDEFGFLVADGDCGIIGAGSALRPMDVASSIQDATGAALKAMTAEARR